VPVFRDALIGLDGAGAKESDPITVADFLDHYAQSLKKAGHLDESEVVQKRAQSLRDANPGKTSRFKAQRYQ
jgi:hypothetical protein